MTLGVTPHACPAFAHAHRVTRVERELIIALPLPEDMARRVAGRPRGTRYPPDHRARALGPCLWEFRVRHGLAQEEVAAVLGADRSAVAQWERGATIPEGMLREQWPRATVGAAVAAILGELQGIVTAEELRMHYRERDGDGALALAARCGRGELSGEHLRRAEDAAYALRWLALAGGQRLDLARSLVPPLPLSLLDDAVEALSRHRPAVYETVELMSVPGLPLPIGPGAWLCCAPTRNHEGADEMRRDCPVS